MPQLAIDRLASGGVITNYNCVSQELYEGFVLSAALREGQRLENG